MLFTRSFARSAPRAVSRLTSSAIRRPAARQVSLLQSSWKPARTQYAAAFSTSAVRSASAGEGDEELAAKLESEIQMENEMKEEGGLPASIKDYLENGPFELKDVPGREDVTLTRQFGDEKIQVTFSIADLNSIDPEADYQDRAMNDEEDNINQGNPNEFKVAPEDSVADNEGANEVDEHEPSFPARVNVIVEKPGHGALAIETVAQDGMIVIENVYHYADAAHAHAATTEKLHERQDMYVGPPFSNLDEDLQVLLERYLEERGVNTALAIFIPDYIDAKEQKEYLGWLSNVKNFVEA